MSTILELAEKKPKDLVAAIADYNEARAQEQRMQAALDELEQETEQAQEKVEQAQRELGKAEVAARVDRTPASQKALDKAWKDVSAAKDQLSRLQGTDKGLVEELAAWKKQVREAAERVWHADGAYFSALFDATVSELRTKAAEVAKIHRFLMVLVESLKGHSHYHRRTSVRESRLIDPETGGELLPRKEYHRVAGYGDEERLFIREGNKLELVDPESESEKVRAALSEVVAIKDWLDQEEGNTESGRRRRERRDPGKLAG